VTSTGVDSRRQRRGRLLDLAGRAIGEDLVANAPADYDEAVETVPVAPGWVRLLVLVSVLALSWALIILVAIALAGGASKPKPKRVVSGASHVGRDRLALAASGGAPPVLTL
jgi:hypothetical protein